MTTASSTIAQCPLCGNCADGRITIIDAHCTAKIYQDQFDYFDSHVDNACNTQCDLCLHRAPFSEFVTGFKPFTSVELEDLVAFLGVVAKHYKDLSGERMARRCIGLLRYLDKPIRPATAGES
jgi:hypothetical protein